MELPVHVLPVPVSFHTRFLFPGTGLYRAGTSPSRLYSGLFLPLERLITAGLYRESSYMFMYRDSNIGMEGLSFLIKKGAGLVYTTLTSD